jgi:hypothetical protein
MIRSQFITVLQEAQTDFQKSQQELTSINDSMQQLENNPVVKKYRELIEKQAGTTLKVNQQREDLYWNNIRYCDHIMVKSKVKHDAREGRTYYDYDCCCCPLTSRYMEDADILGPYYTKMSEVYKKIFPWFHPDKEIMLSDERYNAEYARELYQRAIKETTSKDRNVIVAVMLELIKKDIKAEKQKQKTHQIPQS